MIAVTMVPHHNLLVLLRGIRRRLDDPVSLEWLAERVRHAAFSNASFPVNNSSRRRTMPTLTIERKQLEAQRILFIRRRIARSELQGTLADCFRRLFGHGQKAGLAIAGWPPRERHGSRT